MRAPLVPAARSEGARARAAVVEPEEPKAAEPEEWKVAEPEERKAAEPEESNAGGREAEEQEEGKALKAGAAAA